MRNEGRNDLPQDDLEVRVPSEREMLPGDGLYGRDDRDHDASLGELFRRLTSDTTELLRAEVELAKAEVRQTGTRLAKDAARIGMAAGLAFVGTLALTAFLVIGLGNLLGGRYWLSSLIVGVAAAGTGYAMVQSALHDIKEHGVKPEQTLQSLRENAQWAKAEAREVKRELTGPPSPYHTNTGVQGNNIDGTTPRP
jgi:uncharacterized membrane protein YqjE